jgi:hypothetical protein
MQQVGAAAARYKVAPSRYLVPRRLRLLAYLPETETKGKMIDILRAIWI